MNAPKQTSAIFELLVVALLLLFLLGLVLLSSGCAGGGAGRLFELPNPLGRALPGAVNGAEPDPLVLAALQMTRWGVLCIVGGLVFGAFTRFRSGWGLSLAAAGTLMILLAWTFSHPLTPWAALLTVLAYAGYKIYNRLNPQVPTEGVWE